MPCTHGLSFWSRGRAEQEPRISIPVPAVPVSELLAGKKTENLYIFELILGKIFFLSIFIQKVKVTPLNQFRELQILLLFPARSSDTGTAGTGIEILGSFSARPLTQIEWDYFRLGRG